MNTNDLLIELRARLALANRLARGLEESNFDAGQAEPALKLEEQLRAAMNSTRALVRSNKSELPQPVEA